VEETELYGAVVIAKGCVIRGSSLQDCMIFGGTTIDHCTLRDCVIDEGCMLCGIDLTGKMIRAGTTLEVTNGK
jgi:ADP-glucose pyrophosphorylase